MHRHLTPWAQCGHYRPQGPLTCGCPFFCECLLELFYPVSLCRDMPGTYLNWYTVTALCEHLSSKNNLSQTLTASLRSWVAVNFAGKPAVVAGENIFLWTSSAVTGGEMYHVTTRFFPHNSPLSKWRNVKKSRGPNQPVLMDEIRKYRPMWQILSRVL